MRIGQAFPRAARRRGRLAWLRRFYRDPAALFGGVVLGLLILLATLANVVAPHDPNSQDLAVRMTPPFIAGSDFPLGTDYLGRDILSRLIHGTRVSLFVGISSVLVAGIVGVFFGLISGYYSGIIDDFISWLCNVFLAIPHILLAIAVVAVLGTGLRNLVIVLGLTSWVVYARVVRGDVLATRERDFVDAARATGAGNGRIILRHILPNVTTPLIVIASFQVARMVIAEASLSFLGLGVESSVPSWGSMLSDGRNYLATSWWVATFPGLAILLTVLGINMLGEWLRDVLDPRLRD